MSLGEIGHLKTTILIVVNSPLKLDFEQANTKVRNAHAHDAIQVNYAAVLV